MGRGEAGPPCDLIRGARAWQPRAAWGRCLGSRGALPLQEGGLRGLFLSHRSLCPGDLWPGAEPLCVTGRLRLRPGERREPRHAAPALAAAPSRYVLPPRAKLGAGPHGSSAAPESGGLPARSCAQQVHAPAAWRPRAQGWSRSPGQPGCARRGARGQVMCSHPGRGWEPVPRQSHSGFLRSPRGKAPSAFRLEL